MQNLYNELIELLESFPAYIIFDDANNKSLINKGLVIDHALKLEPSLIKLLLTNASLKKQFFIEVEGIQVFDKVAFQRFVNTKNFLPDSYTKYKNKIGLSTDGDHYLTDSREVVLVWPYKDCVLEGGQTKEDARRDEVFYNTTLAPDEIDVLTAPKVLTNWKRYDKDGETDPIAISKNDNLIIKGNNLLALHTLKEKYRGQVKLIYIDPPYNTTGAANTFAYNNTFNHSSWLSFMKNRLDVAKSLLKNDGIIAISIDHFELFYLGVLMDEIFEKENRIGVIAVVHNPGGRQDDQFFPTAHENMLFYAKNKQYTALNTLGDSLDKKEQFKFKDEFGNYKLRGFRRSGSNSRKIDRPGLFYSIFYNTDKNSLNTSPSTKNDIELLPIDEQGIERCWRWGPKTFLERLDKYITIKESKRGFEIYTKEREGDYKGEKAKTIWDKPYYTGQSGTNALKNDFGEKVFSYPKSPYLIRDVIQISTNEGDLVLDFFGGSGTTAVVSAKMNRRFIICEQMDYVESVTKERIKKAMNDLPNNSFIYAELMKSNQQFIDEIQSAKKDKDLEAIWLQMQETAFLSYKVIPGEIKKDIHEFEALSFEDKQKFLIDVLDKNLLYVNYSEINSQTHQVSDYDKEMNQKFYSM